ncbi:hypothetical protein P170DRAFT_341794, partial [Aspergillus steynii IBT 23096]
VNDLFGSTLTQQIFHQYVHKLAPVCPVVVFPPGTTSDCVRKTKPLLFIAILSVAPAGLCTQDQHRQLALEVRNFLAETAIFEGEKSLQLIQALLVVTFWYRAPENFARTNQNQLASVALSIAIDLGLDRIEGTGTANLAGLPSLSLIMRRPNPVVWNPQLDKYVEDLRQSRLSPTDEFFCNLLATEHSCHLADEQLSLSDPSKSVSLWEPNRLSITETIQARADGLSLDRHSPLEKSLVKFGRLASSLYAHELALHANHNIDEFRAPFFAKSIKSISFLDTRASDTAYLSMIRTIIMAAQGLLDTFLDLSISEMLSLPPHIYAGRVIYAATLLMKLHKALLASASEVHETISVGLLRLEAYIDRLVLVSKQLSAEDQRSSLSRAFLIMPQFKEWL